MHVVVLSWKKDYKFSTPLDKLTRRNKRDVESKEMLEKTQKAHQGVGGRKKTDYTNKGLLNER